MEKDHSIDNPGPETREKKLQSKLDDLGSQVENLAAKTAESIKRAADKALASRSTVLTIRVNEDCNRKLNMLVDAGLFKSRSESAAAPSRVTTRARSAARRQTAASSGVSRPASRSG